MSRRTVREKVVQALYECDFHPENEEEVIASRGEKLDEEERSFYLRLAHGIRQHAATVDVIITRFLKKGWSLAGSLRLTAPSCAWLSMNCFLKIRRKRPS